MVVGTMSQYICPFCKGEFHTAEDHTCAGFGKLNPVIDAPARAEENLRIGWEQWEMAKRFPCQK